MKYISNVHFERLDEIKHNAYLQECADHLQGIEYHDLFEGQKEKYFEFVRHVYKIAKKYNIDNKKYIFSIMLLWYVEGDTIAKDETFLEVLRSKELENHEKSAYFSQRSYEKMEEGI